MSRPRRTRAQSDASRPGIGSWVRAAALLTPLVAAPFAVRACGERPTAWSVPAEAATSPPVPPTGSESGGDAPAPGGGGDGAIRTEEDEIFVLRREASRLPLDDESRILLVLEQRSASPGQSDSAAATRVAAHLQEILKDGSPVIRSAAVALLGRMSPNDAPDALIVPGLGDESPRVRAEAVRSLTVRGPAARVDRILGAASDPDPGVRRTVASALGRVQTKDSQAQLLAYLDDPDGEVVRAAGESLARTLQTLPPALTAAASSDRPIVRIAAARALAALGAKESLAVLTKLSGDTAWEVRREAIRGLAVLGEPHAAVAKQVLEDVARAANRPRTDRFEALQAMARTPLAPDAEVLVPVARTDADQVIRMMAARTLLARSDVRGLGVLADLLTVDVGPRTDEEDRDFIRATSARMLEEVAGEPPGDGSQKAWKAALPQIEARLAAAGFEYVPEPLAEFW